MKLTSKQKLRIAKAWMNTVLFSLIGGMISLLSWLAWVYFEPIFNNIDWVAVGVTIAIVAAIIGLVWVTDKAEKYIDNNGGWDGSK